MVDPGDSASCSPARVPKTWLDVNIIRWLSMNDGNKIRKVLNIEWRV